MRDFRVDGPADMLGTLVLGRRLLASGHGAPDQPLFELAGGLEHVRIASRAEADAYLDR